MVTTSYASDVSAATKKTNEQNLHHYFGIKVSLLPEEIQKIDRFRELLDNNNEAEDDEYSDLLMEVVKLRKELCLTYHLPFVVSEECDVIFVPEVITPARRAGTNQSSNLDEDDVLFAFKIEHLVDTHPLTTACYLVLKEKGGEYFHWLTA